MGIVLSILAGLVLVILYLAFIYRAPDMSQFDHPMPELIIQEHEVSDAHNDVVKRLEAYHGQPATKDIKVGRQRMVELFSREVDADIKPVDVNGIPGEWVTTPNSDPSRRLLYLHGGAFMVGSPETHRYITSELARRTGVAVLAVDYRMMPEFKVIHCHEDARIAYRWILENGPDGPGAPTQLFVAGDSAGGNLTLAVIAWARDNGLTAADGAIALAPLTDATMSSPSWQTNLETDPFLAPGVGRILKVPRPLLAIFSRMGNGKPTNSPELSPLFGSLSNLPPTLIQVSRHEMLFDDANRYANKAAAEGGDVTLQAWPKLVHVFQGFPELPETDDALNRAAEFIKGRNTSNQTEAA